MQKTPQNIDFKQLKNLLSYELDKLKDLEKEFLEKSERSTQEDLYLLDLQADIRIKTQLLEEYKSRCTEQELRQEAELKDYLKNNDAIFKKARKYANYFKLPVRLRSHLKKMLSEHKFTNNEDYNITFFLALKKEIEMCDFFLNRKNDIEK